MVRPIANTSNDELQKYIDAVKAGTREITKDRETAFLWLKAHGFLRHLEGEASEPEETHRD